MSMHKIPLTPTEETGLRAHGLDIGTPSQLSDAFRLGVAWGEKAEREACAKICDELWYRDAQGSEFAYSIRERSNAEVTGTP